MNSQLAESITVVLPTHNRADFLRRSLYYFSCLQMDNPIIIADSSSADVFAANAMTIAQSNLQIEHVRDLAGVTSKCRNAMERVDTPFTVFCADDDFLMPDSALACTNFLQDNADYNGAAGTWVQVEPNKRNRCNQLRCFSIENEDPMVRFGELATHWFSTFYAVHRTDSLAHAWRITDDASDCDRARIFPEKLLAQLSVVYGKFAVLPQIHYLFELHNANEHANTPLISDADSSAELYERFATALTGELATQANRSEQTARQLVDECFGMWNAGIAMKFDHRAKGIERYKEKLQKEIWLMRDRVVRNPTKIWLRRSISQQHPRCQTRSWQLAYELIDRFPNGMTLEENENRHRSVA